MTTTTQADNVFSTCSPAPGPQLDIGRDLSHVLMDLHVFLPLQAAALSRISSRDNSSATPQHARIAGMFSKAQLLNRAWLEIH